MSFSNPKPASAVRIERTSAPLYYDVYTALERAIFDGVWKPGEQIPTEGELERQFGASRGTLRRAVSELVRKGWLYRQSGRGTFVLGPSFHSLERYFRYETLPNDAPIKPHNVVLDKGLVAANDTVAHELNLQPGSQVAHLRRLRHHNAEPFLLIDSYFPMQVWDIISGADFTAHPLYDVFKDQFGLYVVSAEEFLRADLATSDEVGLLRATPGCAVIRLERTAHTFEKRPIEYRRAVGRADRFRYHVRLE